MKALFRLGSLAMMLLLLAVSASLAQAMNSGSTNDPETNIMSQEESTLARTAIVALRRITQARTDIHQKELSRARLHLEEAERIMETIKENLSTATVKNLIGIARKHLEYEQAKKVLKEFPHIYSSLQMISVYLPTDKAKRHLDRAKDYLEKDKKWDAERELAHAEKSLITIEVELPLLSTQQFVIKAQGYLVKNESKKADDVLKVAELRAMDIYLSMNSTMAQVKQNTWLAFQNYQSLNNAKVAKHLQQARSNLNKAAAEDNSRGKEETGKLSAEISGLEKKLATEGKVVESDLKAVWEKSAALAERTAAYASARLSEAETTLGVEDDLIEARLHVTYAEIYQTTTLEPDKAVKEIETSETYLQKAADNTLTDPDQRKKIQEIKNILVVLKLKPEMRDITVKDRYESIKDELRELSNSETLNKQDREMQNM